MAGGVHGEGHAWQRERHAWWGACMVKGMHGRGCAWQGTCMVGGVHGRGGACMAESHVWWGGGMHGGGPCVAGACMAGGMHGSRACVAGEMATAAVECILVLKCHGHEFTLLTASLSANSHIFRLSYTKVKVLVSTGHVVNF